MRSQNPCRVHAAYVPLPHFSTTTWTGYIRYSNIHHPSIVYPRSRPTASIARHGWRPHSPQVQRRSQRHQNFLPCKNLLGFNRDETLEIVTEYLILPFFPRDTLTNDDLV